MSLERSHDETVRAEEGRLRRNLGVVSLTAIGFSNIVGSGWLFSAMYAGQIAGPAALLAWVGAGLLCALIAMVLVELGASRPEGGGTVRWPLYANGRLVGSIVGWSTLLAVGSNTAEIMAILQYAAHYLPWLLHGKLLSWYGVLCGVVLGVLLTTLNWYGVQLFGRVNNLITIFKIGVPLLTVVALLASGSHAGRLTDHGGFAPYGYAAVLAALSGGGIIYAVSGYQAPVDFSGEAINPRRTVPLSVLLSIGLAVLTYIGLQAAFLFTVPDSQLAGGWAGVQFDSPFGQLALILNLWWLSVLLYADAMVSPGGSGFVGIAMNARHTYALAKNRLLPTYFMRVHDGSGIPRRALALNLAILVVLLLPFGGWQDIVSVMGTMYLMLYSSAAVAAAVFARVEPERLSGWVPGLPWIAPLSFVAATECVYWSGWDELRFALPLLLFGVPLFLRTWYADRDFPLLAELRKGGWLVGYLIVLTLLSWLGTFKGSGYLPAPYDSILVAVLAIVVFRLAVRSGAAHLTANPSPLMATDRPA
ncbi:APC family permease [Pseudonocardia spinosispora]|uniref:APC family permease n=1 Tax=Pseudonocardia spinosispora TaxID=103441 RepID=UPI0004236346|nr:APC family permease [Pseudonocardia spinosispora]